MTKSMFMKGLLGASALILLSTGNAFAQNNFTPADTEVENTFNLQYNVGAVPQPVITNDGLNGNDAPTLFRVDRLVNVTVASSGTPGTFSPNQQDVAVEFSVRNDGNDTHAYLLDFEEVVDGTGDDDFNTDASTSGDRIIYFVDANGDGALDAAEIASETLYNPASDLTWPILAADESIIVRVIRDIPIDAEDGEQADIHLFADTRDLTDPAGTPTVADNDTTNTTLVTENVLADVDGPAVSNDAANDGAHSATNSYVVLSADVSATKDVFVLNADYNAECPAIPGTYSPPAPSSDATTPVPNNGYHIPNACVEYFITVRNDGAGDALAIDLLDNLPEGLVFQSASLVGDLTGGTLTAPAQGTLCTLTPSANCVVNLTGGTIAGTTGAVTEGHLVIRATIQ